MQRGLKLLALLAVAGWASIAGAHGFSLSVNYDNQFNPLSLSVSSQDPYLDQLEINNGPENLFLGTFSSASSDANGVYFPVIHGFAQTAGPWLPYTASFDVLSPLYFSNGVGPATVAPDGTYIDLFNLWAGNPYPTTSPHPGAGFGDVYIHGNTSFLPGLGVSLYDTHELEKDLYIGSGPTYGAYGFAFSVTVHLPNNVTLTTGPLVDVFAISDDNYGNFAQNASVSLQDAATLAIYNAAIGVPEPSTLALGSLGLMALVCGAAWRRRVRGS